MNYDLLNDLSVCIMQVYSRAPDETEKLQPSLIDSEDLVASVGEGADCHHLKSLSKHGETF